MNLRRGDTALVALINPTYRVPPARSNRKTGKARRFVPNDAALPLVTPATIEKNEPCLLNNRGAETAGSGECNCPARRGWGEYKVMRRLFNH
jgi:hypothetical protein